MHGHGLAFTTDKAQGQEAEERHDGDGADEDEGRLVKRNGDAVVITQPRYGLDGSQVTSPL